MYTITMTVQYYYVSNTRNFQANVKNNKKKGIIIKKSCVRLFLSVLFYNG